MLGALLDWLLRAMGEAAADLQADGVPRPTEAPQAKLPGGTASTPIDLEAESRHYGGAASGASSARSSSVSLWILWPTCT